jgi:3-oxoacyl-[acyl-carrier-protein] synthase II
MSSRVVITGIGTVTASGLDYKDLWNDMKAGKSHFSKEKIYLDSDEEQVVSRVSDEMIQNLIPKRILKKVDKFSSMALIAAEKAMEDANLVINDDCAEDIGIILGNCTGGWSYVEPQLYDMYQKDLTKLNSYVATSWFPTAPQGEISIKHNILGYSKTISADSLSGGYAINHALHIIKSGKLKGALVGASEAPLTPLVYNAMLSSGQLSKNGKYNPYTSQANGQILGEGSIVLVLEDYDYAISRGAEIIAEIESVKVGSNVKSSFQKLYNEMNSEIDYIFLDGRADIKEDKREIEDLEEVLGTPLTAYGKIPVGTPKNFVGNLLAASIPLDIAIACLMLKHQELLPTFENNTFANSEHFTNSVEQADTVKSIVINGQDFHNQGISILIKHP